MKVVNTTKRQICVKDDKGECYYVPPRARVELPTITEESKLPKGLRAIAA